MKQVTSLCLLFIVFISSGIPAFAQKSRRSLEPKIKAQEASNRFGEIRAYTEGTGVLVKWEMAAETNNFGFYVYRNDGSALNLVSQDAVLGSAATYGASRTSGNQYSVFDRDGNGQSSYYVQSLQMDGKTLVSETVSTEYVADLRTIGSENSLELNRQIGDAKSNSSLVLNKLELPRTLAKEVSINRPAADLGTHQWVIAQPGARIGVRREGFHRVSKAELQAAGYNVNGNSSLWQLYVEGVEQAMIVGPNADYIEFFGRGTDTPESDTRMYYLVSGPAAGKRIETRSARPSAGTVTTPNYSQTFLLKQRTNYVNQVLNGDAENYWGTSITTSSNSLPVNFTLAGVDFTVPNSTMELNFQGFSFDPHVVQVTLNGEILASANGNSRAPFSKQYVIPTSFLREGANSIVFRSIGAASDFSFFDSISIGFARKHRAAQNRLSFYTQNSRISQLEGFSSQNVRVLDMTAESSPVLYSNLNVVQDGSTFGITMPAGRGRSMVAVEDTGLLPAVSVSANDPAMLSAQSNAANLVVISHKNFLTQSENWANYRRGQGFTVKVVEVSEIYDEFNYGVLNSDSIKSFLEYSADNWQTAPSYVLFIGDASYDSRNYQGLGFNNLVPTRIVNTVFTETASDDYLADFNNDGLSEMAVGRIPARDAQAVTNALAKVTAYELAAATIQSRGVLFAYDLFDVNNNYDFQAISTRIRNQLPPSVPVTMIGRGDTPAPPDTPQTLLLSSMNTGKYIVNYSGHGATGTWANPSFFSSNNVPQMTNANNQSIFTMLTCLNGFFNHANFKSLAENLLDSTNGGAVAAWASTGETTPFDQELMATRFYLKLGVSPIERLGDLINDAKIAIPGGVDVRYSWALIGDPMLKVRTASTGDRQQ